MGLRGPGARPLNRRGTTDEKPLRKRLPWQRKGLSRAERVIRFCQDFKITSGRFAGKKVRLRKWQKEFIQAVYAEDAKGIRQVRTAVWSLGRKNGKTQLAALLALCHLCGPEAESRGEVYSCANDRFQASKIYSEMVALIGVHREIAARVNIIRFRKEIEDLENGSVFAALSADAKTKLGLSPSCVIYDELGAATKRDLLDAMDTAMGAREEPLMLIISTQAPDDFAPLSELIDYGLQVQAGEIVDPSFHLSLYTAHPDLDPFDEATWALANPALGDFRSLADVRRQAAQAERLPSKRPAFENLVLNRRIAAHTPFLSRAEWDACEGALTPDELRGRECFGGLDLGGTRDLTALVLAFPSEERVDLIPYLFMPEHGLSERSEADRVPYSQWAEAGHIVTIPGSTIDPHFLASFLADRAAEFSIQTIAYDRWRIEDLKRELDAIGAQIDLTAHGQGFRDMAPAVDELERAVIERRLRHPANPVLSMCAANAVLTLDPAGNRKLDKAKAKGRIDGLVAATMALGAASRFEPSAPFDPFIASL